MSGTDVMEIQAMLNSLDIIGAIDGVFGPQTQQAVEGFKVILGLFPMGL